MSRAQAMVVRDGKVLMVKHAANGLEWWCLPGGAIEPGEPPAEAALRELEEECCVRGVVLRETAVLTYGPDDHHYTFLVDIQDQEPRMGNDPEFDEDEQILADMRWMPLTSVPERDRGFLWAAGLITIPEFADEVLTWQGISYPNKGR